MLGLVSFTIIDDLSGDEVITIEVTFPGGRLLIMGEPRLDGRRLIAERVHMHGLGLGPNEVGPAALRAIAETFLAEMDCDELILEGAVRTTGANPSARPRPVRFTRRDRIAARSGPG